MNFDWVTLLVDSKHCTFSRPLYHFRGVWIKFFACLSFRKLSGSRLIVSRVWDMHSLPRIYIQCFLCMGAGALIPIGWGLLPSRSRKFNILAVFLPTGLRLWWELFGPSFLKSQPLVAYSRAYVIHCELTVCWSLSKLINFSCLEIFCSLEVSKFFNLCCLLHDSTAVLF